jgi:hypothetical protein
LTLLIAAFVIGFGSYRLWLALRKEPPATETDPGLDKPTRSLFAGSFYRMGKRTHLLIGIVYILLGIALVATSFGFNPLGNSFGPSTETPPADQAPTKSTTIKIDQLPPPPAKK